jgi:hypothetical protein
MIWDAIHFAEMVVEALTRGPANGDHGLCRL